MQDEQSKVRTDDVLSQADIILPSQYYASSCSARSGEQRLMLAVLLDAVNVLQRWKAAGSPRKRRNFAETAQWVNTRGTRWPFSFESVCDALGIDSELMRSRLRRLTVRPDNLAGHPTLPRLRLGESRRSQHMTPNRLSGRQRIKRYMTTSTEFATTPASRSQVQTKPNQDCTEQPSADTAGFASLFPDTAIGSW